MSKVEEKFIVGNVYFQMTFVDIDCKYPEIESFVFIGKNIDYDETEDKDRWYFQDTESYYHFLMNKNRNNHEASEIQTIIHAYTYSHLAHIQTVEILIKTLKYFANGNVGKSTN